ncbi:hypothetical protein WBG78_25050 [Chryseolinea sp. T2]|uniref:hypothetical protein n=1 Tax=Chryseolinea sp. T2 TaxID=3129255 RepID=UPI0030787B8A
MLKRFQTEPGHLSHKAIPGRRAPVKTAGNKKTKLFAKSTHQADIMDAMQYARIQMEDPEARTLYESHAMVKGRTGRSLALFDYLIAPTIKKIDATKYTGVVGETIRIRAVDDFMVVTVGVLICNTLGEVIERGAAVPQIVQDQWVYRIKEWNDCLAGCTVVVSAHDVAGNVTSQTLEL